MPQAYAGSATENKTFRWWPRLSRGDDADDAEDRDEGFSNLAFARPRCDPARYACARGALREVFGERPPGARTSEYLSRAPFDEALLMLLAESESSDAKETSLPVVRG